MDFKDGVQYLYTVQNCKKTVRNIKSLKRKSLTATLSISHNFEKLSIQWPKPKLHVQQTQRDIVFGPHELFHVSSLLMFLSMWYTMWFNVSST